MNDIDDKIRNGLRSMEDDPQQDEPGLLKDVLVTTFRGRLRVPGIIVWCLMLIYGAAAVYFGLRVGTSESLREMVLCGGFMVIAVTAIMVTKLWYWMLANRNAVQREVKRLEIRIAELTDRLSVD
jgi:hypothetical protein